MLFLICVLNKRRRLPLAIYFAMNLLVQLFASVYFFLAPGAFPYTISDYSGLYMIQQLCVWLSFIVIAGVTLGLLTVERLGFKTLGFLAIMSYSLVFGSVRYVLFLWLLQTCSILYMPLLFFALGPFSDFLYFVYIYGHINDRMVKRMNTVEGQGKWQWF